MSQADLIRNELIEKLLAITDAKYLMALRKLVEKSANPEGEIALTKAQIQMLQMGEADMVYGRTISANDLDKRGLEWLSRK